MSFWDNVTGGTAAPAPRQQAPVSTQQPWFRQPVLPPTGMPQFPQGYPQAVEEPLEDPAVTASKRRAPSSRSNLTCPNCGGSNIGKPSPNVMEQCFECGWNPRFDQMAAGIRSGGDGPASPSRQVSTANNFNPTTIVGTVGG